MLEQKVAKVDCETHTLFREPRLDVLVYRELGSKTHRVVAIDSEGRWPEKDLVCLSVRNYCIRLLKTSRAFANQFSEESPVPFVRCSSPLRWTVSVDEAVVEYIRTLAAVVLKELRERST